ncbi:MAG TPA: AAA family ATPase, partial [Acidobacteriota bacterium]|nr:AAA family ATPase [Acidobacteriota bacterium]
LGVAILKLPPLRERQGDVKLLIERLLDQVNQESRTEPGYRLKRLAPGAITVLQKHDWPGNIRELLNTLRRAAVWSPGETITIEDARDALLPRFSNSTTSLLTRDLGNGFRIEEVISEVRTHYIKRALREANQNRTKAAELLGLNSYQTLSNWIRDLGIGQDE